MAYQTVSGKGVVTSSVMIVVEEEMRMEEETNRSRKGAEEMKGRVVWNQGGPQV